MKQTKRFILIILIGQLFGLGNSAIKVAAQEFNLAIQPTTGGGYELSWDSAGQNANYTVEYASDLSEAKWINLLTGSGWPINETSFSLPLISAEKTVFYRLKIEDADPHQVRWFATEISPHPKNKLAGYPDPELGISFDDESIIVTSNGIPTFEFVISTPNELSGQDYEWEIPRFPEPADELMQIPLLGVAAFTTTGLPIYGPNEAQHPHPYGDPYINGILDYCHGHTAHQGDYHFHYAPTCLIKAPDGTEEHYNIIAFALDGYPIIAHYKSVHGKTGDETFGWQEVSGYEPDADYKEDVIEGNELSTYAWDNHNYEVNRNGRTLGECNGRALINKIDLASGETFDEASFFGFEYAYFVTGEFPYFIAKYRGTANITDDGGGGRPPRP